MLLLSVTDRVCRVLHLSSRHSLIDWLHSVAHGKLIHYLLRSLIKVHLPRIIPFSIRNLHNTRALHICDKVEEVLGRGREGERARKRNAWVIQPDYDFKELKWLRLNTGRCHYDLSVSMSEQESREGHVTLYNWLTAQWSEGCSMNYSFRPGPPFITRLSLEMDQLISCSNS